MPVLVGTPSLILISRVQVYQTCSVDLAWQRAVHACQRCPKATLTTNAVIPLISLSGGERTTSRFCPAGVHMSHCVPASEIFTATGKSTTAGTHSVATNNDTHGASMSPAHLSWGPPDLPLPAASPNHPVHAAHIARSSYPPASSPTSPTTSTSVKTTTSTTVHHFYPVQRSKPLDSKCGLTEKVNNSTASATITPSSTPSPPSITTDKMPSPSIPLDKHIEKQLSPIYVSGKDIDLNGYNNTESTRPYSNLSIEESPSVESHNASTVCENNLPSTQTDSLRVGNNNSESFPEPHTSVTTLYTNKSRKENGVATICSKVTPNGENHLSTDSEGRISSRTATSTTTNKLLNHHDADIVGDTNEIKTNKTSLLINDQPGSKQQEQDTSTTPTPALSYNLPSENDKLDVAVVAPQHPHVDKHEANKPYLHHSTQSQNLVNSDTIIEDVTSVLVSKPSVLSRTLAEHPTSINSTSDAVVQNKTSVDTTLSSPTPTHKTLPSFHFPFGTTRLSVEEINVELERIKRELNQLVDSSLNSGKYSDSLISHSCFGQVAKVLNCPLYWKHAIYINAGGTSDRQPVTLSNLLKSWSTILNTCPDEASKFVQLLTRGRATYLVQSDFNSLIQDILESHPGLAFLEAAKDFHSRYVATVVARIFFNVNISWSGRITLGELRRSNFLPVLASLEMEDDINLVTQYFSYEHFYVIYCKFWELDEDHDLIISRTDLARHNNYAISERMIDRIFSGAVTRGTAFKEGVMTYPDFVWFLLAEEDKHHPRSIEYWFRCMDLDGDGLLSMYELEYFYSEQLARMEEMGIEPISFEDCLCQCLDMVKPALADKIRLSDMKQCRLCHIFFDTFFNLPKYLQHEQRDPFANLRDIEEGLNELSDWDRYAAETYEMLVNVEGGGNPEDGGDDDDDEEEEDDDEEEGVETAAGGEKQDDIASSGTTISLSNKNSKMNRKDNIASCALANKLESVNNELISLESTVGAGE
ncbi:Serine/threonine-protein phosphatase 2A regulatory subunit B'' subunit alpha [Schistosoma japonicum]|nr:Serine/threonine-protein phosphatase 2A regulatory subunit B'' subunit alpha [Schistosoma japonicum]